jgi:methylated-DNA-[protein]-cysteine S-methyltransferase
MRTHQQIDSPIGTLTLVATDGVLSGLYMHEQAYHPDPVTFGPAMRYGFEEVAQQLGEFFAGERREFTVPIAPSGTPFQRRVWSGLLTIPYGETRTYGQLADAIADRHMTRAVGSATGRNPISIIIPCHRLIGADGSLTGYAGGLARKRHLLDLETGRLPLSSWPVSA